MLSAQKDGPLPKMAACSKKDAGKTHKKCSKLVWPSESRTRQYSGSFCLPTLPPPLLCLPGFMNSRVLMYLARWGGDVEG